MTPVEIIFLWSVAILLLVLGNYQAHKPDKIDNLEGWKDEEKQKAA